MPVYHFRAKALIDVEAKITAKSKQEAIQLVELMSVVQITNSDQHTPTNHPVFRLDGNGNALLYGTAAKMWITKLDKG